MGDSKTLILIDGHALAFRQYYALERTNMRTNNGTPTWAAYGFFKAIFDLLNKQKPDAICVAFDVSHQTFRVEEYSEYKANRQAMPDNMRCQMDLIYEGLDAFNIPIYTKMGYEADDVIGTIAKQACEDGHKVLILTGDQDSFQLIDKAGCTKVIIPYKSELIEYDWDKVYEKLGVYPDQVIDYKSLRGDSSDNIPGVKGIGEKTATKLLSEYGTLDNILKNCDKLEPASVRDKICADIEMAKTSYFLATIVRDVDIYFDFNSAKVELPNISKVTDYLKKMQFLTFLKNLNSILSIFNLSVNESQENIEKQPDELMQLDLFSDSVKTHLNKTYNRENFIIKDVSTLNNLVNSLKTKSLFAFKSDFISNNAVENEIRGITISYNDDFLPSDKVQFNENSSIYNVFHLSFSDISSDEVISILKPVFEDNSIKKITYDAKSEINLWKSYGVIFKGIIFDVLLASYVKDMSRNHSLSSQAFENLDFIIQDDVQKNENNLSLNLGLVNLDFVSDTVISIFELAKFWSKTLDNAEQKLLYEIELPLTSVLAEMEFYGVSIDQDYLLELSKFMNSKLRELEQNIFDLAGENFNISSPKQVAEILFDKLGLTGKGKKRKKSTSAAVLEELAEEYEIASLILEYRKFAKLKSTYTDTLPDLVSCVDNRIHTTYNQTVTATGRLSSSNPNLQNIPIRTSFGAKIRKAFVCKNRTDYLILAADYSQIELRLLAHISQDENLIEAFNSGVDVHTLTASKVFGVEVENVTKDMRYKAKAVNFGIVYGQSKYGLAKSLGISNQEAAEFIDKYFDTYPKIYEYMQNKVLEAESKGFVTSLFGRKRYLNTEFNSPNSMVREFAKRAAINYPMQSSASDLIKIAMIDLAKKMSALNSKLIMQVHDELVIEVDKQELDTVKNLVKSSMELGQPLDVPLVVDVSIGETWQES